MANRRHLWWLEGGKADVRPLLKLQALQQVPVCLISRSGCESLPLAKPT